MTKFRFRKGADGTIVVRAERRLGKQLVANLTKVIKPGEDVSSVMKELYKEVRAPNAFGVSADDRASERRVGE